MRNSERLQHEMDTTLEEVETFLHELSYLELPEGYCLRRKKLESQVKLLRAKYRLHLHRMPFSSLRLLHDPFPKDLEQKRPRASTSPDQLLNLLPDVPEEEDEVSPIVTENQQKPRTNQSVICDTDDVFQPVMRPRSASFPLSL